MIFSFHVGLTDSVMQRMQFFFCQCLFDIFIATALPDFFFFSNTNILSLFDTMLNFVVNLLENERDPRSDQ
jgi:hypothetical protein